ncbi:hypothetical protein SDJN03_12500, partial [Cucurbita argyrosperma subsp. sororia]
MSCCCNGKRREIWKRGGFERRRSVGLSNPTHTMAQVVREGPLSNFGTAHGLPSPLLSCVHPSKFSHFTKCKRVLLRTMNN